MPKPPRAAVPEAEPARDAGQDAAAGRAGSGDGTVRTLRCRTVAQGRFSQLNYIRDLQPQRVAEEEASLLEGKEVPNASEALLAALGSCMAMSIHANAVARHIPIESLELELDADLDASTLWRVGTGGPKPIGFERIRLRVRIGADAPRPALEALVRHATIWSPVANTLHNPVQLEVSLTGPAVPD